METPKAKEFENNVDLEVFSDIFKADYIQPHPQQLLDFSFYLRSTGPDSENWAAPVASEQSAGTNKPHPVRQVRKRQEAAVPTWPSISPAPPAPKDVSKYYPSPMSSMHTSPMSLVTILPPSASTPMSSVHISPTPTSQAEEMPFYGCSSSMGNIETPNYSYTERSVGTFDSEDISTPVRSSFNPSDSRDSGYQSGFTRTEATSTSTADSSYASCSQRRKPSTPASSDSDSDSDSDDESVDQESNEGVTPLRISNKRKRPRVYIHVEDLISCFQKKRRLNSIESLPLDPQPDGPKEKQGPSPIIIMNPLPIARDQTIDCGTQTLDAHVQTQFENKNPEQVTVQNTHARDIDSDVDDDGSDSDEDDEALPDETDSQHKFELFDMLAFDTFDFGQCTTDSSNESRNGNSTTTGSSKATPSSVTTGSLGFMTPGPQADKDKSPGDTVVAVGTNGTPPNLIFGPLELRCWHAAYGFRCPGKTGTSPDVRRLLDDHSYSKKSSNHHKLPPKCQLCDRLFENEQLADEHNAKLKIKSEQCSVLPAEELEVINSPLNLKGISSDRKNEIDAAIRKFNKNRELPQGCDITEFNTWIARNRPIHIGRSTRTKATAERELGKWFVVWYTLFPEKKIPYHPFDDGGLDPKKCERILDLSMSNILEDSTRGLLPALTQEHQDRIRQHIRNGMELQWLELLQDRNATQKARKARMPPTPNPSPSPLSMSTPAPKQPRFFPRDHPGSATFKPPSPGGMMGPPPTPSPDARTPPASAPVTGIPFPPLTQVNGDEANEAEDEEDEKDTGAPAQSFNEENPPSTAENDAGLSDSQDSDGSGDSAQQNDPGEFDPYSYQGDLLSTICPIDFENLLGGTFPPA